jgi:hypothetical protein
MFQFYFIFSHSAGESEPHLLAMMEYLSHHSRIITAVENGLLSCLFRRLVFCSPAERVLTLQVTEKICALATGRDEFLAQVALENALALMQV